MNFSNDEAVGMLEKLVVFKISFLLLTFIHEKQLWPQSISINQVKHSCVCNSREQSSHYFVCEEQICKGVRRKQFSVKNPKLFNGKKRGVSILN